MRDVCALLLAAGAARRFGGRRLLAVWQGEPLVRGAAHIVLAAPVDHCIAVAGCGAELVEAVFEGLDPNRRRIVRALDWNEGIAPSALLGEANIPGSKKAPSLSPYPRGLPLVHHLRIPLKNLPQGQSNGFSARFSDHGPS